VVETDIADCFKAIPYDQLMHAVEERVCDRRLLALLRAFLRAGVMDGASLRRAVTGTPQGGVISPLLANRQPDHRLRDQRPAPPPAASYPISSSGTAAGPAANAASATPKTPG